MSTADNPLLSLTAGDLMSRDVKTLDAGLTLRGAAVQLARWEVHGAPVVDRDGHCVGVVSVSDLARGAAGRAGPAVRLPRTCSFQEVSRAPGGDETVVCRLPEGVCSFQRVRELADGRLALACAEPHCVPVEWQVVELESRPGDTVRDVMSTTLVTAGLETPVTELARLVLDRRVHRLIVLDAGRRPVGVVTVDDLLQVLAHPELGAAGDAR